MKKILLTLIVSVLALSNSFAQEGLFSNMVFGPRVALGVSTMEGNHDTPFSDAKFAYSVGAFAEFEVCPFFSVRPELNYAPKGGSKSVNMMGETHTADITIRYLEMPILGKFRFGNFGALVGPYFAMKVAEKELVNDKEIELADAMKAADFDAGLSLGASYQLTKTMGLDLRVNHGFIAVKENTDTRNISILLGLSYSF